MKHLTQKHLDRIGQITSGLSAWPAAWGRSAVLKTQRQWHAWLAGHATTLVQSR
jgi:hypothetical protein